jgi:hypothetical protein
LWICVVCFLMWFRRLSPEPGSLSVIAGVL